MLRRATRALLTVAFVAIVAVGCGGDDGSGDGGESGIVGKEGPLSWLPGDTWLVVTVDASAEGIDTAVETLDRLPAWSLAESFLPASDGKGLRAELLDRLGTNASKRAKAPVSANELEVAFGDRAGAAITSTDFESMGGREADVVAWIQVDDEDAALAAVRKLTTGGDDEHEHAGVTYFRADAKAAGVSYLVRDGLLLFTNTDTHLESLIDVRDGDDSLARDEIGRAVIEGGIGDALGGVAIQTDPLLDAAPELVHTLAKDADDPKEGAKANAIADKLGAVLEDAAIDGLVADWISTSLTIDETGLRSRSAWSNPRDLADPKVGARELTERMPADVPVVSATVQDGTGLRRVQDAWSEVQAAYDLDLRSLAKDCEAAERWACDLGIELALTVLEDDGAAKALADQGDTTVAFTQDLDAMVGSMVAMSKGASPAVPKQRLFEIATTADPDVEWTPSAELAQAATAAGIVMTTNADNSRVTLRLKPGSPIDLLLRRELDVGTRATLATAGFDVRPLLTSAGLTFETKEVDGIFVNGFPQAAPSKVVPALTGDGDTLADSETYRTVTEAADPPGQVGAYGYLDLTAYAEGILEAVAASSPEVKRVIPTVRNNLADAPGILWWSTRTDVDGIEIGVFEMVAPILE